MANTVSPNDDFGSFKHLTVQQTLRMRIAEGKCPPGSRLPTQRDLSREFGLSPVTLQKATHQLVKEGFLRASVRHGTFVADNPPNLCRYGLVFPSRENTFDYWTDFWSLLRLGAEEIARTDSRRQFTSYYNISGHSDVEDYRRLIADVRTRRLAGIILLTSPHSLHDTPLMNDCPVPSVYIGGDVWRLWKMPSVAPDGEAFTNRALEYANRQGKRRPAAIGLNLDVNLLWPAWSSACRAQGMEPARWQLLSVNLERPESTRHLTQVLMMLPPEKRPDTLLVTDDHIVEEVTAGILSSNLPESEWPTIVAQTNFPKKPRALVPVTFLGFESIEMIRACLSVLDEMRAGHTQSQTVVPPVFASERTRDDFGELVFPTMNLSPAGVASVESV